MKSITVYSQIFIHVHSTVDGFPKTPHRINLTSDFRLNLLRQNSNRKQKYVPSVSTVDLEFNGTLGPLTHSQCNVAKPTRCKKYRKSNLMKRQAKAEVLKL